MLFEFVNLIGYACLLIACLAIVYFILPGHHAPAQNTVPAPTPTDEQWAERIDAHCQLSHHYSIRVQTIALALAKAMGLTEQQRGDLATAALLHHLGKLELPATWFSTQAAFNPENRRQLQWHPVLGAIRAGKLGHRVGVLHAIRWHQEQWDGMGFPDGLSGDAIPVTARVLALAEATASLLEAKNRQNNDAPDWISHQLRHQAGLAFDPTMTRVLTDYVLPRLELEPADAPDPHHNPSEADTNDN